MEFKDIKNLSTSEIRKKEAGLRRDLFESSMKNSLGQQGNPIAIRGLRRDIARLQTALNQQKAK